MRECSFCHKQMATVCICGAYIVVPGYEQKSLKEQPYMRKKQCSEKV